MMLTIIIPVYNVEKYILDCLNSVYSGNLSEFEVLCIDDRGQDNSINIIKNYIKEKNIDNLRIIEHEKNKGLSEARNTGIKEAKGNYICFLDSDDMINAKSLNTMVDLAIKNDLDILEENLEEIFETDMKISVLNEQERERKNTEILTGAEYFLKACKENTFVPMVWCRIYKAKYLLDGKYEFKPNLKFEDEEFSPRAIINASKIQYVDEKFYIYRRRDDSITTNMAKNNKWVDSYLIIINSLDEFSKTIKDEECYYALQNRIGEITLSLYKNPIAYKASKENLEEIIKIVRQKKLYKIPRKCKNISIRMQGILMKYPKIFAIIYKKKCKGEK